MVPGFNIPYLPMMRPVADALKDTGSLGLIMVARLEWKKFESGGMEEIREEYEKCRVDGNTRLHLDHIPVIDEDGERVPYLDEIRRAIDLGFGSVMVDGSRLSLGDNIAATREVAEVAHSRGIPVEGELGAVMGHEEGPLPPYEELFAGGKGFTNPDEARRFVRESGVDWLSIACGNIHGAISKAAKEREKVNARLSLERIGNIAGEVNIPLVLHGGTGIAPSDVRAGVSKGIAKINIATAIRQPYERALSEGNKAAASAVYNAMRGILENELRIAGSAGILLEGDS